MTFSWQSWFSFTGDGEVFMLGGSHHGTLSDLEKMSPARHLSGNASRYQKLSRKKTILKMLMKN